MIDNAIFLIIICLVPWLCFKGAKIDDVEKKKNIEDEKILTTKKQN
jgi:hypothetical protein